MKRLLSIVLVMNVFMAKAQTYFNEKSVHGGFGHFFIGPALIESQKITDYLKSANVLGSDYSPSKLGYAIGGEGGAMFQRFYIGGGGFGMIKPEASSSLGKASTSLGAGYFKVGYRYYSTRDAFMHVYTGFGGVGYTLEITNTGDSIPIEFNRKSSLAPGRKETYTVGGFLFDIGTGVKTFVFSEVDEDKNSRGGLMIGIDIGCLVTMPITDWQNDNKHVSGPPDLPAIFSPYVRLTLGGGGFRYK